MSFGFARFEKAGGGAPPPPSTLIANTANTIGHWTGDDLSGGSANTGPIWIEVGTVPPIAATSEYPLKDAVGPFSDSNYFKLTHPSIFNQQTFSMAIVMSCADLSNTPYFLSNGNDLNKGWIAQLDGASSPTGVQMTVEATGSANTFTSNKYIQGDVGVLMVGYDAATGTVYAQINNNTLASSAIGANLVIYGTDDTELGRLSVSTGFSLNGAVYEVYLSSDIPSHAFFNSLYQQVVVNGAPAPLIPETANTVSHVTATDLANGTSHKGPVWTKNGTVALGYPSAANNPKRAGVGPFSTGNSFSLAHPSVIDFTGSGPFTSTFVIFNNVVADDTTVFAVGNIIGTIDGWGIQNWSSSGGAVLLAIPPYTYFVYRFPWNTTGFHVITVGADGSGNFIAGLDGVGGGTLTPTIIAPSTDAFLGGNATVGAGNSFNGLIYEFSASTDPCDSVSIAAIYAAILANI